MNKLFIHWERAWNWSCFLSEGSSFQRWSLRQMNKDAFTVTCKCKMILWDHSKTNGTTINQRGCLFWQQPYTWRCRFRKKECTHPQQRPLGCGRTHPNLTPTLNGLCRDSWRSCDYEHSAAVTVWMWRKGVAAHIDRMCSKPPQVKFFFFSFLKSATVLSHTDTFPCRGFSLTGVSARSQHMDSTPPPPVFLLFVSYSEGKAPCRTARLYLKPWIIWRVGTNHTAGFDFTEMDPRWFLTRSLIKSSA